MVDTPFIPHCLRCGYDLSHLPDGPCPECGEQFTYADLRQYWLTRNAPDSDEVLLRGFIAICPHCKYDLSASPEGPCPECGTRFTIAGLHARWIAARRSRPVPGWFLFAVGFVISQIVWTANLNDRWPDALSLTIAGSILAACSFAWACAIRERLLQRRPGLILLALPIALVAGSACHAHIFWAGPLVAAPWCLGVFVAWLLVPKRHLAVLPLLVAICLLTPGMLAASSGLVGLLNHHHWSNVDDWFGPGPRRGFPPTMRQELTVGLVYLVAGLVPLGIGIRCVLRRPWDSIVAHADSESPRAAITPSPSPPPSSSPCPPG